MKKVLIITFLIFCVNGILAQSVYQIDNLDFEKGELGAEPFPWRFPQSVKKLGYEGYLTDTISYSGRFSFKMINPNIKFDTIPSDDPNECTVYQNIDPQYYLNKKVRFSIYAKLESNMSKTRVELWMISKDGKEKVNLSYFDTINISKNNDWEKFSIEAEIPPISTELRFGVLLVGGGIIYLDNANFEVINPKSYVPQYSLNLNSEQLQNINNLAKINSAMRYFLPSDKASSTNWDSYLENYLFKSLPNSDNNDFLENYIAPFKYSVFINDNNEPKSLSIPKITPNQLSYAMLYRGVPNPSMNEDGDNYRKNIYSVTRRREASITFMTDLIKYGGKELRISADIKVNKESAGANAQLWARTDIINSREFVTKTSANDPVATNEWQKRTVFIELPENVYRIKLALVFLGEGTANFDNIVMEVYDKGKLFKKIDEYNLDFESPASLNKIKDWEIEEQVIAAGYSFEVDKSIASKGNSSLLIKSDNNRVVYPEEASYLSYNLKNNKSFNINICTFTQNGKTIPIDNDLKTISEPDSIFRSWEDVNSRVAALIQMYSLITNFAANEINQSDIDSSFIVNLDRISKKLSFDEYMRIYNQFLLVAKDSRSRIWNSFLTYDYAIPLLFKKVDIRHIVVQNFDDEIPISIGDEIIEIDGIPINLYLESLAQDFYSGNLNYKLAKAGAIARAGNKNSKLVLTTKTGNNAIHKVEVKRNRLLNEIYEVRPQAIQQFNDSTLYVDLTEINDNYFKDIIDRLQSYKYFIFDLRGESVMSEHILSLFTDTIVPSYNWIIPFYTHPFKKNATRELLYGTIKPNNKLQNKKLYFLINERSTGYSDFISRIIKKNKLATLVGTQTQGNPSELVSTKLSGGFSLTLSSILNIDESNRAILDSPVQPDILVEDNLNKILNNKDAVLEKVLELISNQ